MIGAIEILIIVIIFGIIYGRYAIYKTFKKHAEEGVVESFSVDVMDFYKKYPIRLVLLFLVCLCGFFFVGLVIFWSFTRFSLPKLILL